MADTDTTLREALDKAADESDLEVESGDQETSREEDETSSDDTTEDEDKPKGTDNDEADEDEDEEDVASAEEQKRALDFYRKITNDATARPLLEQIARRAGYEFKALSPTQQKAVSDGIEETLREELGDEYSLLPAGLSKALSRIIDFKTNKSQVEIDALKAKLDRSEEVQNKAATDAALSWAAEEYPEFVTQNKRVLREMKAFPPPPGIDGKDYIKKICKLADIKPKSAADKERSERAKTNKDGQKPSDGVRRERSTKVVNSLAEAAAQAYDEQFKD